MVRSGAEPSRIRLSTMRLSARVADQALYCAGVRWRSVVEDVAPPSGVRRSSSAAWAQLRLEGWLLCVAKRVNSGPEARSSSKIIRRPPQIRLASSSDKLPPDIGQHPAARVGVAVVSFQSLFGDGGRSGLRPQLRDRHDSGGDPGNGCRGWYRKRPSLT